MSDSIQERLRQYSVIWLGTSAAYENWAKQQGISANILFTYEALYQTPHCTSHYLAEKLSLPKQTMSSILTKLIEEGMIEKKVDPYDKRNKLLSFTPKGLEIATSILSKLSAFETKAMANMTESQRAALIEGGLAFMKNLQDNLE